MRVANVIPDRLFDEFPCVVPDASWGQWWRIHSAKNGPWWFSAADRPARTEPKIGRFDLPFPNGTCYLGAYLDSAASENLRESTVTAREAQTAADERHLSQMPLGRWYGERIANFTSEDTPRYGAPADIAILDRPCARRWALAAHRSGFQGLLYRLREDPQRRCGLALFGHAGESPPPGQSAPSPLPVGLRKELLALFEGEYRGDPLPT
jgi:hypothetical protein